MNIKKTGKTRRVHALCITAAAGFALLAAIDAVHAAAPAAGDRWAYRVENGYNHEARGRVQYQVDKVEADRIVMTVTGDGAALGGARTEVYTSGGNWLRHPLINHDQLVDYEFTQPYPAYPSAFDAGKTWSTRVAAVNSATHKRVSVRVDGEVLGSERVTVAAGAFDAVKIRRRIYAGDFDGQKAETNIMEVEWYVPGLGRTVRMDSNSDYMDPGRCGDDVSPCTPVRGDWNIFELVETGGTARQ